MIELMIAVAVLALLTAAAVPRFSTMVAKSQEGKTKANLGALRSAMSVYFTDNGNRYPSGEPSSSLIPKYLREVPRCWTAEHGAADRVQLYGDLMADNGGWGYWLPGAAADEVQGRFFVSCAHRDLRGRVWSTQ